MSPRDQEIALLVEGINGRELAGVSDLLHPGFEFHAAIGAIEQRVYVGAVGMLQFVTNMDVVWDEYQVALGAVQHVRERAVAVMHISGRARASGVPLRQDIAQLITWRDGRMWRAVAYTVPADAIKAAGVEEQAMSRDNVEVVRRAIEAFNRRDLDALMRDADPDVEVDWSRSPGVESGTYRGVAAARGFWSTFFDAFEQIVAVPEEFIEHRDHVLVPNRAHVRGREGIEVDADSTVVVGLRDARIVLWRLFQTKTDALEAVGLQK